MSIHRGRSKLVVARARGITTNKYGISFWGNEIVLNLDSGTGCTAL